MASQGATGGSRTFSIALIFLGWNHYVTGGKAKLYRNNNLEPRQQLAFPSRAAWASLSAYAALAEKLADAMTGRATPVGRGEILSIVVYGSSFRRRLGGPGFRR